MPVKVASRHILARRVLLFGLYFAFFAFAASPCVSLGVAEMDRLARATQDYKKALEIWGNGKSQDAETLLNHALSIREALLGPDNPSVGQVVERLGALSYNRRNYPDAEVNFRRALDIYVKAEGEESLSSAALLGDLGATLREERRFDEAKNLVERSLAVRRKLLPADDLAIAGSLNNLGRIFLGQRLYAEAHQAFENSLRICATALPSGHPRVLEANAMLRQVERAQNLPRDMKWLGAGVLASLLVSVICSLWSEINNFPKLSERPWLAKILGVASAAALFCIVGCVTGLAVGWALITISPNEIKDRRALEISD